MKLYTVDVSYVKELHNADSEVFYSKTNYDNKPYVGIIVFESGYNYFIPLTSAKPKHKAWKNVSDHNFLVYEFVDYSKVNSNSIFVRTKGSNDVKHIISVLEIHKMIPVPNGLFSEIDIDNTPDPAYKDLLNKEYYFLKSHYQTIQKKAEAIYSFQIDTGKVFPFYCDFKKLEAVCDSHLKEEEKHKTQNLLTV